MGTIDTQHPSYQAMLEDWELLAHSYAGQRTVKAQGERYLPPTTAMRQRGYPNAEQSGTAEYNAYRLRARFPDYVGKTVRGLTGVIHQKPPVIELPGRLEEVRKAMTSRGEPLELLWRRITAAQLLYGRGVLLLDVPDGATANNALPYVSFYSALSTINWDVRRDERGREYPSMVVFDESGPVRSGFQWDDKRMYRMVTTADQLPGLGVEPPVEGGAYVTAVVEGESGGIGRVIVPSIAGSSFEGLPVVFFSPGDMATEPDVPPFAGLAELCMCIYRGDADHRQALFMQGQDTLVRIGAVDDEPPAMGAGAHIDIPTPQGDAKFIGPDSAGLPEMRQSLENDRKEAQQESVQALDDGSGNSAESGEALRIRAAARTATLADLQNTAAAVLKEQLVNAGRWFGISEAELDNMVVEPNMDFSDVSAMPSEMRDFADALAKGFPLSRESAHEWARRMEYTSLSWEEEQTRMQAESMESPAGRTQVDIDPQGEG